MVSVVGEPSRKKRPAERRRESRIPLPSCAVASEMGAVELVNLSRSGMRLEVEPLEPLEIDALFHFKLSDGSHSARVEGRVRWLGPERVRRRRGGERKVYEVGVAFTRLLTPATEGIWGHLAERAGAPPPVVEPPPEAETAEAARPRSRSEELLISILEPADGATVGAAAIVVVGAVRGRLAPASVVVNGHKAELGGDRFEARVRLRPGPNRITAIAAEVDGTYRSSRPITVVYSKRDR